MSCSCIFFVFNSMYKLYSAGESFDPKNSTCAVMYDIMREQGKFIFKIQHIINEINQYTLHVKYFRDISFCWK